MSDFLYVVFTKIAQEYEHEHNVWQETEHRPYLLGLPGYQSVAGYKNCGESCSYANFWHISSPADFDNPDRKVRANTPWGLFLSPYRERRIDFFIQDEGLDTEVSPAENSRELRYIAMDVFSDEEDQRDGLSAAFREGAETIRKIPGVLDARLYHAYGEKTVYRNFKIYYLSEGAEEALEKIDAACGKKKSALRLQYEYIGGLKREEAHSPF